MVGKPFIVLFLAGKGGVGKSMISTNVARRLSDEDKVAFIDADLEGSNSSTCFDVSDKELNAIDADTVEPIRVSDSIALMNVSAHPALKEIRGTVMWDRSRQEEFLEQALNRVKWPFRPRYLLVDCPAGVGSAIPAIKRVYKRVNGAVMVSTPAQLSIENAEGVVTLLNDLKIPIFGILNNMSSFKCSRCGHEEKPFGDAKVVKLAKKYDIPLYGGMPLMRDVADAMDRGKRIEHVTLDRISADIRGRSRFTSRIKSRIGGD